jgi:hypothetical protein
MPSDTSPFFVAVKTRIIIECSGGVVTAVLANRDDIDVTLIDWDDVPSGEDPAAKLTAESATSFHSIF